MRHIDLSAEMRWRGEGAGERCRAGTVLAIAAGQGAGRGGRVRAKPGWPAFRDRGHRWFPAGFPSKSWPQAARQIGNARPSRAACGLHPISMCSVAGLHSRLVDCTVTAAWPGAW
jgi:hypothetical protein